MLFEYVAEHIYDTDAPAAERRAAALVLDPALLAELLGTAQLRDLLDPQVILEVQERLQRTEAKYRARGVEGVADLLRQARTAHGKGSWRCGCAGMRGPGLRPRPRFLRAPRQAAKINPTRLMFHMKQGIQPKIPTRICRKKTLKLPRTPPPKRRARLPKS